MISVFHVKIWSRCYLKLVNVPLLVAALLEECGWSHLKQKFNALQFIAVVDA